MPAAKSIDVYGTDAVKAMLDGLSPGLDKASERAQNKMAYILMQEEREQAESDFDFPTKSTISSILYKKYGANSIQYQGYTIPVPKYKGAGVFVGDLFGKTQATTEDMLGVQIYGGLPAGPKRSEKILRQHGFLRDDQVWVPSEYASLDVYGNIPGSDWSAAITNLGWNQYAAPVQEKQWHIIGRPGDYHAIVRKQGGVWLPWVYFISKPYYTPAYAWEETADLAVRGNFAGILDWYVDDELKQL